MFICYSGGERGIYSSRVSCRLRRTLALGSMARISDARTRSHPQAVCSFILAERGGFEPPVPFKGYTPFPRVHDRPLWHLSRSLPHIYIKNMIFFKQKDKWNTSSKTYLILRIFSIYLSEYKCLFLASRLMLSLIILIFLLKFYEDKRCYSKKKGGW